jgi:predicted enzyme related to lactoylglutathione lyase
MAKRNIVHLEISAKDRLALANFYADLFGWEVRDFADMNYTTLGIGNKETGLGIMNATDEAPGGVSFYIESTDLEGDLAAIVKKGGEVLMPRMDVEGVGSMAFFRDPAGNVLALGDFIPPSEA